MQKLILFIALYLSFATLSAQVPTQINTVPGSTYVYAGSLILAYDNPGNSQKIVIKIFGGSWFSDTNGETSYYISNRSGLSIREVSLGSSVAGRLALKVYQNGTSIDFYIVPIPTEYTSFAITSYSFGNSIVPQFINITSQNTAPVATDITSSVNIIPVLVTDPLGNIGIGTSTPRESLSVNGGIRSKEVKVETANWPDYVFKSDYVLRPLSDLKTYVDKNNHLPEFPSEKDVKEEGLNLGKMNNLLTKKVEELTLYLIEHENKLQLQQSQINKQNSKIDDQQRKLDLLLLHLKVQKDRLDKLAKKLDKK